MSALNREHSKESKNLCQEHLFTLEKRLYASPNYLEKYAEPKSVEDLDNHFVMSYALPEKHPYSDINWILRIGMKENKLRVPIYMANTLECLVEAAKKGLGIIGAYNNMSLIREAGLVNILPNITDKPVKWCYTYSKSFENDKELIHLKNFLLQEIQKVY